MAAIVMDGVAVSRELMSEVRQHAEWLATNHRLRPRLTAVLVGNDPASHQYVRNKQRAAVELGFSSEIIRIDDKDATTESLLETVSRLSSDPETTGIIVQLPLPETVDKFRVFDAIAPLKDVDAVSAASVRGFYRGEWGSFLPCTPRGVLALLDYFRVPTVGRRAVVIGRSDIAGKPLALILGGRMRNATVTWCHSYTTDLATICREADLLVSCVGREVGRPFLISADMVKPGACVIDVGFRRIGKGKFTGDVDFERVREVAGWITPNPGGTGPMTVVALMQNLIDAARYQLGLDRAHYALLPQPADTATR